MLIPFQGPCNGVGDVISRIKTYGSVVCLARYRAVARDRHDNLLNTNDFFMLERRVVEKRLYYRYTAH
jgi:hypothetical protein